MKFSAIVTYTTGENTGVTVEADTYSEAWQKLLDTFDGGANICRVTLAQILMQEREIR